MPRRLRNLMANANETLGEAQGLIAFAKALLADIADGVRFEVVRPPGETATIMDFVTGKADRLPLAVKVVIEEEDEPEATAATGDE